MSSTQEHLDDFYRFASEHLVNVGNDLSIDELYDRWRLEHPSGIERQTDLLAVKAALRDMEHGDRGIALDEQLRKLRDKYNPLSDE